MSSKPFLKIIQQKLSPEYYYFYLKAYKIIIFIYFLYDNNIILDGDDDEQIEIYVKKIKTINDTVKQASEQLKSEEDYVIYPLDFKIVSFIYLEKLYPGKKEYYVNPDAIKIQFQQIKLRKLNIKIHFYFTNLLIFILINKYKYVFHW